MFKKILIGMCFVLISFAAHAGKAIYKQVDSSGRVSYSDTPNTSSINSNGKSSQEVIAPTSGSKVTGKAVKNLKSNLTQSRKSQTQTAPAMMKVATSGAGLAPFMGVENKNLLFHHHILNFSFNDWDKSQHNYMKMHNHAIGMSYDAIPHLSAKNTMSAEYSSLNRILLHNAYYSPVTIDLNNHTARYGGSYLDKSDVSTINPRRRAWKYYPIDSSDIEIIKGYSCAASDDYNKFTLRTTDDELKRMFRINMEWKRIVGNFQSRFVVDELVKKTIKTLETEKYDILFFDDLPRVVKDCENKEFGGRGSYATWKDGQLDFLSRVVVAARKMKGYHGNPIKIFGNSWSPYGDQITPKWYSENKLRLDHYYFESAGSDLGPLEVIYGQEANGKDPETALPAFVLNNGGYIPANLISLGTNIKYQYKIAKSGADESDDYLLQHYKASGTAGAQGSWFGWYGEVSVDINYPNGKFVHSNDMQLLRAIPNWDNLAGVPIASRVYSKESNTYVSPNSNFSKYVIQGWNPINNELYAVYLGMSGQIDLKGRIIDTAHFVDNTFNKSSEDALSCLVIQDGFAGLKCKDRLKTGLRITFK